MDPCEQDQAGRGEQGDPNPPNPDSIKMKRIKAATGLILQRHKPELFILKESL